MPGSSGERQRWRRVGVAAVVLALLGAAIPSTAGAAKRVVGEFGDPSGGSAGGQFSLDSGAVAVNQTGAGGVSSGEIYVAEGGNHRVQQLNPSGAFVRAWGIGVVSGKAQFEFCTEAGKCIFGAGEPFSHPGAMDRPEGIAVDQANGNLYVTDVGHRRVEVFSATGQPQGAFGFGVLDGTPELQFCTVESGCQGALNGFGAAGALSLRLGGSGIAVSPAGEIYVAGPGNGRVDVFKPTLSGATVTDVSFARAFGWDVAPEGAPGDTASDEFEVCTTACQSAPLAFQASEAGRFNFNSPTDVAIDQTSGEVYVLDRGESANERQVLSVNATGGTYTLSFEAQTTVPIAYGAEAATIESALEALPAIGTGNVKVESTGALSRTIEFRSALGASDVEELGADSSGLSGGAATATVSTQREGFSNPPRVQRFDAADTPLEAAFGATAIEASFAQPGGRNERSHLAFDPASSHLLYSAGNHNEAEQVRVLELDGEGKAVDLHGKDLTVIGPQLRGTAAAPGGVLYVLTHSPGTLVGLYVLGEAKPEMLYPPPPPACTTAMTLVGRVFSEGSVVSYRFEYSSDGEAWIKVPATDVNVGPAPGAVEVEQAVSGLTGSQAYRFRLVATRDGLSRTSDVVECTTEAAPPALSAAGVLADEDGTLLRARVNPQNEPTTYRFEYTTEADFLDNGWANALRAPATDAAVNAGNAFVLVAQEISGLSPATAYRSRIVASNETGQSAGAEQAFTTLPGHVVPPGPPCPNEALRGGFSAYLPHCRAYELVSPVGAASVDTGGGFGFISSDGASVAFAALAGFSGAPQNTVNSYRADRTAAGWSTIPLTPPLSEQFPRDKINLFLQLPKGFSTDFSRVYLSTESGVDPADTNQDVDIYLREPDGSFHWISKGICENSFAFAGNSADASHGVFFSGNSLCESIGGGSPQLANILPAGGIATEVRGGDWGASESGSGSGMSAVSADGRRIFFESDTGGASGASNPETTRLWVRENGAVTHLIADPGIFAAASRDGSTVFFTSRAPFAPGDENGVADLYRYDLDTDTYTRLTSGADPQLREHRGAVASADGGRVYFVAEGVLSTEPNANGQAAADGEDNIYLYAGGQIHFVATAQSGGLITTGGVLAVVGAGGSVPTGGTAAEWDLSPDGSHLAFATRDALLPADRDSAEDIYAYSHPDRSLELASTGPRGGNGELDASLGGGFTLHTAYTPSLLSADGRLLVFQTAESLVPRDVNGRVDVYERDLEKDQSWLISSGISALDAALLGLSADGGDVFFTDSTQLVPQDTDGERSVYDARIGGGFAAAVSQICVQASCRPEGAPELNLASPSTGTPRPSGDAKPRRRCRKGKRRAVRRGKLRCVRKKQGRDKRRGEHRRGPKRTPR